MSLYPPFEAKVNEVIKKCKDKGLNIGLFQGYRSHEEQDRLYRQGREGRFDKRPIVTKAKGGQSWHQFGVAGDLVFKNEKGQWTWDNKNPWSTLGIIAKSVGLVWGGDWEGLQDRPHVQWPLKMTLGDAEKFYKKGGLEEVWKHL